MSDAIARLVTIVVAAALLSLTAYHRVQAIRAARALGLAKPSATDSSHKEGRVAWLRAFGLFIWATLLGYFVDPGWMAWSRVAVPGFAAWLGAAVAVLCVPLIFWVLRSLGTNLNSAVAPRASQQLVTKGPYRWVRHPWYAVLLLLLVGLSLLWSSWLLALLSLGRASYFAARTPIEERALVDFFGDAYRAYARSVPRFLPGTPGD